MGLCVHRPVVGFALDRGKAIVQLPELNVVRQSKHLLELRKLLT